MENRRSIKLGIENLLTEKIDLLRGRRVGLIFNQASVGHNFQHAADLFHNHPEIYLFALFGPQLGIRVDVLYNIMEAALATDRITGLPIYLLYSETREPTVEMMMGI